jgi:hypothetical protein
MLADALAAELRSDWPDLARLDPRRDVFNGLIGFRLGIRGTRNLFLAVTPHDSEDVFRCNVAWSRTSSYPVEPFSDLRMSAKQHWMHDAAEIQLADLQPDQAPYEFELDPEATSTKRKQAAIASRLAAGVKVSEEEWLDTLSSSCSLDVAADKAREAAVLIAAVLRTGHRQLD